MRPELLDLAARLAARGEAFAVVTVVRREPPSSARVGDAAVVTCGGEVHGWVGGGCTRSTLLRESLRAIADGEPRLLSLSPEPGTEHRAGLVALPMTCKSGGVVDLYVEPVPPEGLPQGAYVLVATMSERDLDAIEAAVRFAPAYLGLISSRTRLAELRKTLLARGVAFDRPAPVGARRGSVEYKQEMARVRVGRALRKAVERAGGR